MPSSQLAFKKKKKQKNISIILLKFPYKSKLFELALNNRKKKD
jgi:hypothetical protein